MNRQLDAAVPASNDGGVAAGRVRPVLLADEDPTPSPRARACTFSNAARDAPERTLIRVAAVHEDAQVAVSVSDEGSGVAPERLPHLFSKHDAAGRGATAGHGLGLAICKGLVEAHGGRIRAESLGAGCGTTVTFTMPVAGEADAAVAHTETPAPAPRSGEPPRILVVDDDSRALGFVRDAISEAGYARW